MQAIEYVKSVPRYLFVRLLARHWPALCSSSLACIRLVDTPPPSLPGSEWVHVRPLLSGICGSDLATVMAKGSPYFSPFTSFPFVLGHEVVGEVVECGRRGERLREGDRVVLQPPLSCQIRGIEPCCDYCRAGRDSLCVNTNEGTLSAGIQTGYCRDTGGAWSEGFVAHQRQLHTVPEELSDETAVIAEPFSCALEAVLKAPPEDGQTVLILGCGTIGALTLAAIRGLGKGTRVVIVAKHPHQQQVARRLGADQVIETEDLYPSLAEALKARLYRPELGRPVPVGGADICFDCVGSSDTMDTSLRFTRSRGTVVVVGMPGAPQKLDWIAAWHKELSVLGSYSCNRSTFREAIRMLTLMKPQLEPIVGAKFALSQYKKALSCALKPARAGALKTVFSSSQAGP